MNIKRFTDLKTGTLVKIEHPKEDWAFVPNPLPPNWTFPAKLWPLLVEAKEELARLDGIGRTLPNPEHLLSPLQSREALRSSSLEGTYASPEELLLFELNPRIPSSDKDPANSWLEVSNYSRALRQGMRELLELPFCLRIIKGLHSTLLDGVRGRDKTPGSFRENQVHIGSDFRFIPPPPDHMNTCLDLFEKRLNEENSTYDPLVQCYLFHYQFETIHPFLDGNGRVGRALLSLMIYQWCGLHMPWLYMSAYFERYKDEYIDGLFAVSANAEWHSWIEFCLRGTVVQAKDSIRRCEHLQALRESFHEKADPSKPRAYPIIENLFTTPIVTVQNVATRFDVTYPTAKNDIENLVSLGILAELQNVRPRTFYSPGIFTAAYSDETNDE